MQDKTKGNPTNFKVGSNLSSLFEKAKEHNRLNVLIKGQFSAQFKGLNLCFLGPQSVTLLAKNSSIAFRSEKQKTKLLSLIKQIEGLANIKSITIKVDKKNY
ncbi:hypothetical protein N9746_05615 [Candidatus Thioglobus sp.]|nr:hypothetical protein [Candidatus Thioglobus sp.]